jgi:hypothetical protein
MRRYQCPKSARLLCGLLALLSTACAASAPNVTALRPPDLSCSPDPVPPAEPTPADVGEYVIELWAAGQSCRDAVTGYQDWAASLPK